MREEGYAAVTSRRLASRAGVGFQLVHYYFPSMDEMFVILYRRRAERGLARAAEALASGKPLRTLWDQSSEPSSVVLKLEFMALANHRKGIRAEMARHGEQFRQMQLKALEQHFEHIGIKPPLSPTLITTLLSSVGIFLALEAEGDMVFGHQETREFVESWLSLLRLTD